MMFYAWSLRPYSAQLNSMILCSTIFIMLNNTLVCFTSLIRNILMIIAYIDTVVKSFSCSIHSISALLYFILYNIVMIELNVTLYMFMFLSMLFLFSLMFPSMYDMCGSSTISSLMLLTLPFLGMKLYNMLSVSDSYLTFALLNSDFLMSVTSNDKVLNFSLTMFILVILIMFTILSFLGNVIGCTCSMISKFYCLFFYNMFIIILYLLDASLIELAKRNNLIMMMAYKMYFLYSYSTFPMFYIFYYYIINIIYSHLQSYPCPLNINYLWNMGFMLTMFYLSQMFSGIILSIYYTNDVMFSFYSISNIISEVYFGFIFRYIHSQGASILFALYLIHISSSVFYSSCLFLHSMWFSGIWLYFTLMFISFIGYLLPWGQMSFWGATVMTNLLSSMPFLMEWVCGGYFISNPTLKSFFMLHFMLPFLSLYLIFMHLFYLHFQGSNNPLGVNLINNKMPFYPFICSKDFFGLLMMLFLFNIQTFFGLFSLSHPDNTMAGNGFITPLHILPEWYFLPYYAILKAMPNKNAGFIILMYFSLYLFLSIFGGLSGIRSLSYFPSFILLLLALGWIGSQLPQEKFMSYGRIFLIIIMLFALYFLDIIHIINYFTQCKGQEQMVSSL